MLFDIISSSSSTLSPTNTPIAQDSMENMFIVQEGQVKKYVENGPCSS